MSGNVNEQKGVISWFSKCGNVFGYIESSNGKEVYFDEASIEEENCHDISVGDVVSFQISKNYYGEIARYVRVSRNEKPRPKKKRQPWAYK